MTIAALTKALRFGRPDAGAPDLPTAFGLLLFYAYVLIPARIMRAIAVVALDEPPAAKAMAVGYPYLPVLEVVMAAYALWMWATGRARRESRNWSLWLYVGVAAIGLLWLWIRSVTAGETMFWDGAMAAVRLTIAYALFASLPLDRESRTRHLQDALALLIVSSYVLNRVGFLNPANLGWNRAGRLTAAGLDYATTGYWGCALALSAMVLSNGARQAGLVLAGLLGLAMSGTRNAFFLFLPSVALAMYWRWARVRPVLAVFGGVALVAAVAAVASPGALRRVPLLGRSVDDSIVYRGEGQLSAQARRDVPAASLLSRLPPAVTSRINVWSTSVRLVPGTIVAPLGSDWLVQRRLIERGERSHAHNAYLQTLLKFGVLAVPFWAAIAVGLARGLRARSPYAVVLVFLLAGLVVDYWLLVIKATFLFFVVVKLNDDWAHEHRLSGAR